jgi:predicted RNA methylase
LSERPNRELRATAAGPSRGPWLVRCARGLFRVTADELHFRRILPPGVEPLALRQRNHDLLFVQQATHPPTCRALRTAEEVLRCLVYGRYKLSKAQLDLLARTLSAGGEPYRLAVSVDGTHFVRRDLGRFLERELASRGVAIDSESATPLFVFAVDASYYVGQLTSRESDADFRQFRYAERPGSLPPTIAAAMAFLAKLEAGDTVLDPVCGSGTLLAEAYGYRQDLKLIGVDADPGALDVARKNLAFIPNVVLSRQDSAKLELPRHSASVVLANLPFGKQFGDRATNTELYSRLLGQLARVAVSERWRAVLLTSDVAAVQNALAANPGVAIRKTFGLQVRGEQATIFVVHPEDRSHRDRHLAVDDTDPELP